MGSVGKERCLLATKPYNPSLITRKWTNSHKLSLWPPYTHCDMYKHTQSKQKKNLKEAQHLYFIIAKNLWTVFYLKTLSLPDCHFSTLNFRDVQTRYSGHKPTYSDSFISKLWLSNSLKAIRSQQKLYFELWSWLVSGAGNK